MSEINTQEAKPKQSQELGWWVGLWKLKIGILKNGKVLLATLGEVWSCDNIFWISEYSGLGT